MTPFIFKKTKQFIVNIAYNNCDTTAHNQDLNFTTTIIHTKLRHKCALNSDLFRCNIIDSPHCSCGKAEDTYHYFLTCTQYSALRNEIFCIENLNIVNTHVLLWGDI